MRCLENRIESRSYYILTTRAERVNDELMPGQTSAGTDASPSKQSKRKGIRGRIRGFIVPEGPGNSTVDLVHSTQMPLPLAPIDYNNQEEVTAVLDLAASLGGLLLSCGSGNQDTKLQLQAVTAAYGLTRVQVDITLTSVTVFALTGRNRLPVTAMRVVDTPVPNFEKLRLTDRLLRQIRGGQITLEEAIERVEEIETMPALYRLRVLYFGWAMLAASVTMLLGAQLPIAAISAVVTLVIVATISELAVRGLPIFFQNIAGGLIATVSAGTLYAIHDWLPFAVTPSRIIASGIIVMLAGLTLVQCLQDGMTGAPVTGSARFFDTMLTTGGIIAGIAMGMELMSHFGVVLPEIKGHAEPNFAQTTVRAVAGVVAAISFALASNAGPKALGVSGATAAMGSGLYYYFLVPIGFHPVTAAGVAATTVGLAGGLLSRRYSIPPLITAISGITPFLPGMAIYRGMQALLNDNALGGFANLATALATATALAAGVVLGEWVARQLRRPRILTRDGNLQRPRIVIRRPKPLPKPAAKPGAKTGTKAAAKATTKAKRAAAADKPVNPDRSPFTSAYARAFPKPPPRRGASTAPLRFKGGARVRKHSRRKAQEPKPEEQ